MKATREKPYYTPYPDAGRQTIGQIVQQTLVRSGLSIRKFCEAVCESANNPKALDKTTLGRLINAGRKNGSKGGDYWRLRYIAPFTHWEEKDRPFTQEELIAIALGELRLDNVKFISITEGKRMPDSAPDRIFLAANDLYRLRALMIASAKSDGWEDPARWLEHCGLSLERFADLIKTDTQGSGGGEGRRNLEMLLPHLYCAQKWSGEGKDVEVTIDPARKYETVEALLKSICNGNGVLLN